ncbi:MAG: archease [Candidatus Nanoarchaeia archaeon]
MYKFLEHTADVKFIAEGNTLEEAFISACSALKETIAGDIKVLEQEEKSISVEGKDLESLLRNFLEEFLYLLDAEDFLLAQIKDIKIDKENYKLEAVILGDKAKHYKFTNDVKAVTYHDMFVKQEDEKWRCQVVLDV